MAYREDPDLEFFSKLKSEDFNDLVHCLIYDKDGGKRLTEELSYNHAYIRYSPDHAKYWPEIAGELQCFGANSLAIIIRGGKGVLYKEILDDVCDKLDVKYTKNDTVVAKENKLLMKMLMSAIEKMTPEEFEKFCEDCHVPLHEAARFTPEALLALFQAVFRAGGFKSYQLTLIIVNAIWKAIFGTGLTLATNAAITRIAAILTGPIGWAITGLWTVVDIAGPAYRVTIPGVFQVALLRKKYLASLPRLDSGPDDQGLDILEGF